MGSFFHGFAIGVVLSALSVATALMLYVLINLIWG
jgi:tetrahydromethanopterin S-methyltransferase subunit F